MKCYVAGSYQFRVEIQRIIAEIRQSLPTFESTSTWIEQGEEADEFNKMGYQHFIDLDRTDIARADMFLLINDFQYSKHSTGKWVEYGIALELGLPIVVWGTAQESLFLKDRTAIVVPSHVVSDLVMVLTAVEKTMAIYKETESYAYRAISRPEIGGGRIGATPDIGEARGEIIGSRVRDRESGALHDADGTPENRAQRPDSEEGRTRRRYTEVGTPISQVEP